jgi:glucose-fructose oxidoreductase
MNLLDHPLFHDLRSMARRGYLGRIGLVSARLAHRGGLGWKGGEANWRSSLEKTGGGSFVQLAVHYEHIVRWLLGDRVVRAQAFAKNLACPQLEGDDLALAHLELACGAFADLQTSWCVEEEHISIMGTRGSIHYRDNRWLEFTGEGGPFQGHALRLAGAGEREVVDPLLAPEWDDAQNPFNQHRRFIEALRAGSAPDATAEDGREGVRAVEACYRSAREERVIYL